MFQRLGKKTLGRILSVLLAFSLMLSYIPVPSSVTFAASDPTGAQSAVESGRDTTKTQVRVIVENKTYTDKVYPEGESANTEKWYGTLVDQWVTIDANKETSTDTMMSCVVKALEAKGYSQEGAESNYISSIAGLAEFDGGSMSGWMGTLNDWFTNEGFDAFTVANGKIEAGDIINIMYTCDYGTDLGGTWDNNTKTLKALTFSAGTLDKTFAAGTTSYTLTVPAGTTKLTVTPTATNKNFLVKTFVGTTEYKRTAEVPVSNGTVLTVKCGDPSWPTMNEASTVPAETYTITVAVQSAEHTHSLTLTEAKAATCAEAGNTAYYSCSCGKYFSDAEGKTEIEKDSWVIAATGNHQLTAHEAKEATVTEAGNTAYWSCDTCGKYFSDAEGKTEIEEDSWIIPATGHTVTVKVTPSTVNVKFYTDEACTTELPESQITDSGVVGRYYHQYDLKVGDGTYYYKGTDGEQTLGGDYLTVSDDATVTLYRDNIAFSGSALTEDGDYTFTFKNPDSKDVRMGTSYVSNGKKYTPTLIEHNKTYSGEVTLAEKWQDDYYVTSSGAFTVKNTSASAAKSTWLPIAAYKQLKVTAPEGATVKFYKQEANYVVTDRTSEATSVNNGDGTVTYIVGKGGTTAHSNYQYRATMEGKVTEAGYLTDGTPVTVSFLTDKTPTTTGSTDMNGSARTDDDSSVLLNIDDTKDTNELSLKVGDTFKLRAWRAAWEIINTQTANQMIEPDFHYAILSGSDVISMEATNTSTKGDTYCSGNASSNWMNITALKEGTAVVAVWYDAINITGSTIGGFFGATDPSRYGVFVVNVGDDSTVEWNPVSSDGDWDAEFDTVYYLGDNGTFTIEPKDVTAVSVQNIYGSAAGSVQNVTAEADGSYKVPVQSGANVITAIKADGTKDYFVVRAQKITYSITNNTTGESADNSAPTISTGDSVTIKLNGLQIPIPKMSGIYNPGYMGTGKILYKINDSMTLTSAGTQYDFAHSDKGTSITFTAYVPGTNNLSGYISLTSMGDDFGNHRNTTDEGRAVNMNASEKAGQFGSLPDISFDVTDTEAKPSYDEVTGLSSVSLFAGVSAWYYGFLFNKVQDNGNTIWGNNWVETWNVQAKVVSKSAYSKLQLRYWYEGEEAKTIDLTTGSIAVLSDLTLNRNKPLNFEILVTPLVETTGGSGTRIYSYVVMNKGGNAQYIHPYLTAMTATDENGTTLALTNASTGSSVFNQTQTEYNLQTNGATSIKLSGSMLQKVVNTQYKTADQSDGIVLTKYDGTTQVGEAITVKEAGDYPTGKWDAGTIDLSGCDHIKLTVTSYYDTTDTRTYTINFPHVHGDANYDGICDSETCKAVIGTIQTASVDYTSQHEGTYLHAPKSNVSVSSNLAESYGYADDVNYLEDVSALDVLVQAHLDVYGEDFTSETAKNYLTLSYGSPDKMFNVSTYGGFFLNHAYPNDGTESQWGGYNGTLVSTQAVANGDLVEFYFYEDEGYNDTYNWFVGTAGYSRTITADQDMDLALTLKGVGTMTSYLYKDTAAMVAVGTPIANAQIYTIDPATGVKTAIEGKVTDENGSVTLNFAEPGEYIIAAYGTKDCANKQIMTMTTVQVNPTLVLSADTETVEKDKEVKVSVSYEGTINGFQMDLSYDRTKMEYVGAEWGFATEEEGTDPSVVINATDEGVIYMNATKTSALQLTDNKIVTLTFKAKDIGTSTFELTNGEMSVDAGNYDPVAVIPTIDNQIANGVTVYMMGDVNMDGRVSIVDANMAQLNAAQLKDLNAAQQKAADVYQDESVSILDVNRIQIFLAHLVKDLVIIPDL